MQVIGILIKWYINVHVIIHYLLTLIYFPPVAFAVPDFGGGSGPILSDDVTCSGIETNLFDCNHTKAGARSCNHSDDVGVICREGMIVSITIALP